jgi:hypothetical protein
VKVKQHKKLDRIDFASALAIGLSGYNKAMREDAWRYARDNQKKFRKGFRYYVGIFAKDHRPAKLAITLADVIGEFQSNPQASDAAFGAKGGE